jgi:hypothetical protein
MIWTRSKINYAFVFEFDTRHVLDWRRLSEVRIRLLRPGGFAKISLDTFLFLPPARLLHVAQLFQSRCDVYVLACRTNIHHRRRPLRPRKNHLLSVSIVVGLF